MKYIQQLSGKLGQTIRDYTEKQGNADLELEKFAINSVISATHTADMSEEDQNDIIKKVETSGSNDTPKNDDFGDSINGEETEDGNEQPTEENVIHETGKESVNPSGCWPNGGINILPKDHKQVFVDAKLGVDDSENKKLNNLNIKENKTIFAENSFKSIIMKRINEIATEETTVQPITKPTTTPNIVPTRRQKPWKISPRPNPEPKAQN